MWFMHKKDSIEIKSITSTVFCGGDDMAGLMNKTSPQSCPSEGSASIMLGSGMYAYMFSLLIS
jgi:hypothetical protein